MNKVLEKIIEWGLYLFAFLLPWQTRWIWRVGELNGNFWEYGSMSLYATDILLGFLLLAGLILWFQKFHRPEYKFNLNVFWWLVAFFALAIFISIFWAKDRNLAIYGWAKVSEGIGLLWLVARFPIKMRFISLALVGAAVIQSLLGIHQFLLQGVFGNKWLGMAVHYPWQLGDFVVESVTGRFLRAYGSLPHPNILAGFLVVSLVILTGLLLYKRDQILKSGQGNTYFRLIAFCVILFGLFFSFSRGGWTVLASSFLFLLIAEAISVKLTKHHWRIFKLVLLSGLVFALLSGIYSDLVKTRIFGGTRLEILSNEERIEYVDEAGKLIQNHFLTGVGINNYTLAIYREIDSARQSWDYQPVHNLYILIMAELGILGAVSFGLLLLYIFWTVFLNWRLICQSYWAIVYSIALWTLLKVSFFDHYVWTLHFGIMLWWLILGLWYRSAKKIINEKRKILKPAGRDISDLV
ncbi:MAG: O-antigen ligase family protein [Patescibacteria group bacterium]|nr:O-antigen ligase family protein [Patescibacteria group bacterium]MDD5490780.1 O-antigen ligase family protein [Patescibacteria group bacterium]